MHDDETAGKPTVKELIAARREDGERAIQRQVAKVANRSEPHISLVVAGKRKATKPVLRAFSKVLSVPVQDLHFGTAA